MEYLKKKINTEELNRKFDKNHLFLQNKTKYFRYIQAL